MAFYVYNPFLVDLLLGLAVQALFVPDPLLSTVPRLS